MSKISNRDILQLVAEQIDDSVTWCRFAQVSKICKGITDCLLIREVHDNAFWYAHEYRTRLPCGLLHGEAKGYKRFRYFNKIAKCDMVYDEYRHRWWYTKHYLSGKLHGYFTIGGTMIEFSNGQITSHLFTQDNKYTKKISLLHFPSAFWKTNGVEIPDYVTFLEFEQLTQF